MPLAAILSKPQKPELGTILPELRGWLEQRGWTSVLDEESAGYLRQAGMAAESVARDQMAARKPDMRAEIAQSRHAGEPAPVRFRL